MTAKTLLLSALSLLPASAAAQFRLVPRVRVVLRPAHRPHELRCPGHWVWRRVRVRVAAVYRWRRDACGRLVRVLVEPACTRWVWRRVRVHCRGGCHR